MVSVLNLSNKLLVTVVSSLKIPFTQWVVVELSYFVRP